MLVFIQHTLESAHHGRLRLLLVAAMVLNVVKVFLLVVVLGHEILEHI